MVEVARNVIYQSFMYCYLMVAQGYRRSLPTSKYPSFICRDIYKLYATIYATGSGNKTSSITAYSLICISAYKNLFRTDTSFISYIGNENNAALKEAKSIVHYLWLTKPTLSFSCGKLQLLLLKLCIKLMRRIYYSIQTSHTIFQVC